MVLILEGENNGFSLGKRVCFLPNTTPLGHMDYVNTFAYRINNAQKVFPCTEYFPIKVTYNK